MIHVLFVSKQRLTGALNGSSAYVLQLARTVREAGLKPHLVQPSPHMMGRRPVLKLSSEMDVFDTHSICGVLKIGNLLFSLNPRAYLSAARAVVSKIARKFGIDNSWTQDRPYPYAPSLPWTDEERQFLARAASDRCDILVADYMFQSDAFEALPTPRKNCAILMHDLFHARAASSGADAIEDTVVSVDRDKELQLLGRAGTVLAIQREEAEFVRENLPASNVILVPMAAELKTQAPMPGDGESVLFVGSRTAPNTDGLEWFLQHVWPKVRADFPRACFDIVGSVSQDFYSDHKNGVRVHGMVESLAPFYTESSVVISPLRFGSGLKIKLVEAMSWGKAVVASDVTLQGVEGPARDAVVNVNDNAAFAEAVVSLLKNASDRRKLGEAALNAATSQFGAQSVHSSFVNWLQSCRAHSAEKDAQDVPDLMARA